MVGCGSIGQVILPLLRRHVALGPDSIIVLAADEVGRGVAYENGAPFFYAHLKPRSFRRLLARHVRAGDLLLNLSVDVSSLDLIRFAAERAALYVDTSIEPWPGVFDNPMLDLRQRTNFMTRYRALALARELGADSPTAVVDHGANPGLVSHFVKRALLDLRDAGKRLFLATNSEWHYTRPMMSYILDPYLPGSSWRELFDLVIGRARSKASRGAPKASRP